MNRTVCIALAAMLCICAAAKPSPREAKFLESAHLDADAKVRYFDEKGKAITFDDFSAKFSKGRAFDYDHEGSASANFHLKEPQASRPKAERDAVYALHAGDAFPLFALQTVSGTRLTNSAFKGKTTLVNFFFSTCVPCVAEIPVMNAYRRQHPEVQVLALTFDDLKTAQGFVKQRGLQWPILVEGMDLINTAGVSAFPTFALVGPDGRVRAIAPSAAIMGRDAKELSVGALSTWVAQGSAAKH